MADTRELEHSIHGIAKLQLEGELSVIRAVNLQPPESGKVSAVLELRSMGERLEAIWPPMRPLFLDHLPEQEPPIITIAVGEPSSSIADFSFFGPIDETQVDNAEAFLKYLLKRDREKQQLLAELGAFRESAVDQAKAELKYHQKREREEAQLLAESEALLESGNPFLVFQALRDILDLRQITTHHYFRAIAALPPEYASAIVADLFRWSAVNPKFRSGTQWETLPEALLDFVKDAPADKQALALANLNRRLPDAKGFQRMPEDATERLVKTLDELAAEREGTAGWAEVVGHYKTLRDQLRRILQERSEAGALPPAASEPLGE